MNSFNKNISFKDFYSSAANSAFRKLKNLHTQGRPHLRQLRVTIPNMPRRAPPPPPPPPRVFRTTAEIDRAIGKLERRIQDIDTLSQDRVRHDDARVQNIQNQVRDTIRDEFGQGSPQYARHSYFRIVEGPGTMGVWEDEGQIDAKAQADFEGAIPGAKTRLEGLIEQLRERREDLAEPEAAPRIAFEGRNLHPAIGAAAKDLFFVMATTPKPCSRQERLSSRW